MTMNGLNGLIVYPVSRDNRGSVGILRKLDAQVRAWTELGARVQVIVASSSGVTLDDTAYPYMISGRGVIYWAFYRTALQTFDTISSELDFVYIRYPLAHPGFIWFLHQVRRRFPRAVVVAEVPTYPYEQELKSPVQRGLGFLDRLLRPLLQARLDFVVTLQPAGQILGVHTVSTENGVDVFSHPVAGLPAWDGGLRLLGLGNIAAWHGYDRVIRALALEGGEKLVFDLVGDGPARSGLEALAERVGVRARVRSHGVVTGAALNALFDQAHLAVGSLAEHRRGCSISTTLKLREYCARGVPFVFAGEDPDFSSLEGSTGWRQVEMTDEPLDPAMLQTFARAANRREVRASLRRYAEQRLTWVTKLEPVVAEIRARR